MLPLLMVAGAMMLAGDDYNYTSYSRKKNVVQMRGHIKRKFNKTMFDRKRKLLRSKSIEVENSYHVQ